jgi:hypothetical protein
MLVRCFVPLFCLVAYFVVGPLFCLVAYFDVGPLFRPVVLFGCLFLMLWLRASSSGAADGSDKCCGFGHQARALLAADGSAMCCGFGHHARVDGILVPSELGTVSL